MKRHYDFECNIAQTLNLIGEKWTLLILHSVKEGYDTYKKLQEAMPGIPTNLLSQRLRTLCEEGLLQTSLYQEHPPRYKYQLTDKSDDLDDIINAIILWGDKHLEKSYKCITHKDCEGKVHIAYVCDQCGELVSEEDLKVHGYDK